MKPHKTSEFWTALISAGLWLFHAATPGVEQAAHVWAPGLASYAIGRVISKLVKGAVPFGG